MKRILNLSFMMILIFTHFISSVYATPNLDIEPIRDGQAEALILKELGLFKGVSENDFALQRVPTRLEALVMLIRLMGEEKEAQMTTANSPFTDVPEWGQVYVNYAYSKGYTKGVSADKFDPNTPIPPNGFLTFVLRSLGYSDADGDFTYDNPYDLSTTLNLLIGFNYKSIDANNPFLRAHLANIASNALKANLKNTNTELIQDLYNKNAISLMQLYSAGACLEKNENAPDGYNVISVSTPKELVNAININTIIMLEEGTYDISQLSEDELQNDFMGLNLDISSLLPSVSDVASPKFSIANVDNCHIVGKDTNKVKITYNSDSASVLSFSNCNNCSISNVSIENTSNEGNGASLLIENSNDISVSNSILSGSAFGISVLNSNDVLINENEIKSCSASGVKIENSNEVSILKCYFHDITFKYPSIFTDTEIIPITSSNSANIVQAGNISKNNTQQVE